MRRTPTLALTLAGALLAAPAAASPELLAERCGGCHEMTDAGLTRIAGQRKTPEGWLMTIVRMRQFHGVEMSGAEQAQLVGYLSETQGMAPAETAAFRYALERDPDHVEVTEEPLGQMCARCHTFARVGMQRRTAEEWLIHMHFHIGQFPTAEYQALGRDREWFRIAVEEIAPLLAEMYPLETAEWSAWQAAGKRAPAGDWVVLTSLPGKGDAYGRLTVAGDASPYGVTGELRLADGTAIPVAGSMNLYTGYEWRADLDIGGERYRQVLAISEDGTGLSGRQFLRDADSLGGRLSGVRADAGPTILGTVPANAAADAATVMAVGTGLGSVAVAGSYVQAITATPFGAEVKLWGEGERVATLTAGETSANVAFYAGADRITVEPPFTIARVGGGSEFGPEAVPASFRAIAWRNGPDGLPETEDDIRLGAVPAEWSVAGHDEIAEAMEDAKHAGAMGADGIFMPAVAGPNPERPFSTNNAGDLKITGTALGLSAEARLIVTVQRFIDPPIR